MASNVTEAVCRQWRGACWSVSNLRGGGKWNHVRADAIGNHCAAVTTAAPRRTGWHLDRFWESLYWGTCMSSNRWIMLELTVEVIITNGKRHC